MKAKIRKVGKNLAVILPKKLVEELQLQAGEKVNLERKGSNFELHTEDPEFKEWVESYRQLNLNYKDVLRSLAE